MASHSTNRFSQMEPSQPTILLYRCVCGSESPVDLEVGGKCQVCQRVVQPEAIQQAMSATITVGDISQPTAIQVIESNESDPFLGTILGHFRLDRPLGRGGMGTVYRALDTSLQRYVAVKVVRSKGSNEGTTQEQVTNMLQEAIAQARLNHPNVVTIYYVGRQEHLPFLAMELIPGPTLHERLKNGPLPYTQVIRFGLQIVDALEHAQQFGIVHADIKPSNLLILDETHIKLSDFGLSRMTSEHRDSGRIAGTPSYLAPELLDGEDLSMHSDMYALGVTLFELLFGKLPFELRGSSVQERLQTHRSAAIDFPTQWPKAIPLQIKNVLTRILAKKPSERYDSYDALRKELKKLMPVNTTSAGFAARLSAYGVDQMMLLCGMAPFLLMISALMQFETLVSYQWIIPLIGVCSFLIPASYLIAIWNGWRSLGCYLFQLNVVDEHGLPLRRDLRLTREILRCMLTWTLPLSTYAGLFWSGIDAVIDLGLVLFLGVDIACYFFSRERTTLHDLLCRARVVLDVGRIPVTQ